MNNEIEYEVWVKENDVWEVNGDGPLTKLTADRIAKEIKRECGVPTKVLPVGEQP
jgi:hypothetical protein